MCIGRSPLDQIRLNTRPTCTSADMAWHVSCNRTHHSTSQAWHLSCDRTHQHQSAPITARHSTSQARLTVCAKQEQSRRWAIPCIVHLPVRRCVSRSNKLVDSICTRASAAGAQPCATHALRTWSVTVLKHQSPLLNELKFSLILLQILDSRRVVQPAPARQAGMQNTSQMMIVGAI